jgi:hypothetical protein
MPTMNRLSSIEFFAPFSLPSFEETLPAGVYDIETELSAPVGHIDPATWKAAVLVNLHPRASHPGLARTLSVPLTEIEAAIQRDLSIDGKLSDHFLQRMLDDPLVRLVMRSDDVSERELRQIYGGDAIVDGEIGRPPVDAKGDR